MKVTYSTIKEQKNLVNEHICSNGKVYNQGTVSLHTINTYY